MTSGTPRFSGLLDDERDGALGDRLGSEIVAVAGEAADAEEERSWGDLVGGVREIVDLEASVR